jgi:phage-related protein
MADAIGYATLPIIPSMVGFGPALAAGTVAPSAVAGRTSATAFGTGFIPGAATVGKLAGVSTGASFLSGFLATATPIALVAGVVLGFKGLYEVGEVMDTVTDGIRTNTGAQGAALDGLVVNVQNVGNRIPATLTNIGDAVSGVTQRLGYSGPILEGFTARLLEVGRLQDAPVNINDLSAAITGFRVPGEQANATLDRLFQISQATGVPVANLTSSLATQGGVLGQLGFSLTDSASLLGILDKAGVNSTQVVRSLSAGIVRLAQDGEAPVDAFRRVTGEIQGFVDSGNQAAALDLAGQVFGTRGAAQFVSALQSGTVNLNDIQAALATTGDTILGVSGETRDFSENVQVLQNNLLTRLAPAGEAIFGLFNTGFGKLVDLIVGLPPIGDIFAPVLPILQPLVATVGAALTGAFQQLWAAIGPLLPQLVQLWTTASPVMIVLQALTPILPMLSNLFAQLIGTVGNLAASILPILIPIVTQLAGILSGVLAAILPVIIDLITQLAPVFFSLVEAVMPVVTAVLQLISPILDLITPLLALIGPILTPLIDLFVMLIGVALQPLMFAFQQILPPVLSVIGVLIEQLFPVIQAITKILGGVIDFIVGVFTGDWERAWGGIVDIFSGIWEGIVGIVKGVINLVIAQINGVIGGINSVSRAVRDGTGGVINFGPIAKIPSLGMGADVAARSGGTLVRLAEAGQAETVSNLGTTNAALEAATALAERALAGEGGLDLRTLVLALKEALAAVLDEAELDLSTGTIDRLSRALAALLRLQGRTGGAVTQ